ncbi:hypothetical protein Syun_027705 [Stephania yunnanensis]|uniref:Myb/SANT-like domain-containing protein n=1 Tax=Stephania yunnanensis TaxID=152371 RepID=A0AAP0EGE4_9MAGN
MDGTIVMVLLLKQPLKKKIIPVLNATLGCEKNFLNYKSRWKWFKDRYQGYVELMHCNSGFGWDHVTKEFTASNEVWEEYFKSHPNQRHYQTDTFVDYDDLRIIVGNATASGKYSIGLGDDIDARTFEVEETSGDVLEDLTYDYDAEAFVQRNEHQQKNLDQPPIVGSFNAPRTIESMNLEVHSVTRKMNRAEKEGNLDSSRNNNFQMDSLNKLTKTISSFADKVDRFMVRDQGCWKLIKEIPDLTDSTCFKVLELLNTRAKKIDFMEMSSEERSKWIAFWLTE